MKNILKSISQFFLVVSICLMLAACNKVTQSNFDKIQSSMTMQQVTAILGEPTNSNSVDIGGVSGTSAVWSDGKNEITIQFLNGGVFFKTFSRDGQKQE